MNPAARATYRVPRDLAAISWMQPLCIPLRSLIVRDLTNVTVAGRCMGTDRMMQGSTRVMPCCFITGQAAGTASAMAAEKDGVVRDVPPRRVIDRLRRDNAYIPEPQLTAG